MVSSFADSRASAEGGHAILRASSLMTIGPTLFLLGFRISSCKTKKGTLFVPRLLLGLDEPRCSPGMQDYVVDRFHPGGCYMKA